MLRVIVILLLRLVHTIPLLCVMLFVLLLGLVCIPYKNIRTVISNSDSNPDLRVILILVPGAYYTYK